MPSKSSSRLGAAFSVERLRFDGSISPEHLPIFVPSDQSDLFDRKARLKQSACSFVAKVVEMQVFDLQVFRDEIAKELGVWRSCCRWFLTINSPFDIQRPFLGVLPAKDRLVDVLSFAADLDLPRT